MKFTLLLLCLSFLQSYGKVFSQDIPVSLNMKNSNISRVLSRIEKKTDYRFLYNVKEIKEAEKVDAHFENVKLEDVLNHLMAHTGLSYTLLSDKLIVIAPENKELFIHEVTGSVTDSSGNPLVGVSIHVKGTSLGAVTDANGNFTLQVEDSAVLVVSYLGFQTKEIRVGNQTNIDIILSSASTELNQVVVVGYGTQQKRDLTGAISSIDADEIAKIGAGNAASALQGKVSGVNIVNSGVPGQAPNIRIRGVGTLNNSNPLYVVDGMFVDDISFINSNDIKSMAILKDASATAIYGSRGANGVVLITTKTGNSGEPTFNFNAYEGIQQIVGSDFEMVNAHQYAMLINEGLKNLGEQPVYDPDTIGVGTNWFDKILRKAPVRSYQLSFNQQTDNASYYVSAGYFRQKGILKKSDFERYTIRLNNTYNLTDNIEIGHHISASWFSRDNPMNGALQWAYRMSPIVPVRYPNGDFVPNPNSGAGNPVAALTYFNNTTKGQQVVGNIFGKVNFFKNFTFKTSLGIDFQNNQHRVFNPVYRVGANQKNEINKISKDWSKMFDWVWENTLTYDKRIGDHHIKILGGITAQRNTYEVLGGSSRAIPSDNPNLWYLSAGSTEGVTNKNTAWASSMASYLFRANYSLLDRYLFTGTVRADGSSKFPSGKRWGYFPALALGWRVSEESFMADIDWLSNLKIRGSWGKVGNQKIPNYQYYSMAATGIQVDAVFNNQLYPGGTITVLNNTNITWEVATQTDIGLELGLFQNALNMELDYYNRKTEDILVTVQVPATVGLQPTDANIASIQNRGFDILLNYTKSFGDFRIDIGLVGTTIENEVLSLGGQDHITRGNIGSGNNITRASVGKPVGYFYGYQVVGVFQNQGQIDKLPDQVNAEPGDLIFEDNNGVDAEGNPTGEPDGKIDPYDRTIIGSPIPEFTGGLNLGLAYKGFDFTVSFSGMFGNEIYNAKQQERYSGRDNFDKSYLDRWTGPGTSNRNPRITLGAGDNYKISSRFVEDGSYVKIRNIQLGYSLPANLVEKIHAKQVRVFVSGNNVLYFTDYNGFSPEIESASLYESANDPTNSTLGAGIDRALYPMTAAFKAGLNITF